MKRAMAFFIFFAVVLTVYTLVNYYIFHRGMQAIPTGSPFRPVFVWVFWILASTYVAGRIVENIYLSTFSDVLVWTGSFWLGAMLYFFLLVLVMDGIRVLDHLFPVIPQAVYARMPEVRRYVLTGSVLVVALLLAGGYINARYPRVKQVHIAIEKDRPVDGYRLRAVLLSDIHLGTLVGNGHLQRIVDKVQALAPDIVFLAGDIVDEDLQPVIRQDVGAILRQLQAPLGVFGIMGNHEHIGGSRAAYTYLEAHGIRMLRDSVVRVADSFYLIGREDREKRRFSGRERQPLGALVAKADKRYPVILLDHQPFYLEQAASLGVDLQLSGHTHHGQLWPLNYITRAIYTISHGYGKINGMHAYVSNGVGTWGPPVRIGNRPEIVLLDITVAQP